MKTNASPLHLDIPLLLSLLALISLGLVVLYSAGDQSLGLLSKQIARFLVGGIALILLAQIPPHRYLQWAPMCFLGSIGLLAIVLLYGHIGKGAERWINLGVIKVQPSEFLKITLPLLLAWYLHDKTLPPSFRVICTCAIMIAVPVLLVAKQPDLGTALMISGTGMAVLVLAGLKWRYIFSLIIVAGASIPILWQYLHSYQKQRVLTFLNPESNPLGSGYHIIQSKIAIGSGGIFGKGWLNSTQAHLQYLPEHATDFIFALTSEEFGLVGGVVILCLYLLITGRALYISLNAQDTFSRLLAGGLSLMFFLSFFINIGMVIGLLPVVGLPLPLISYGGSAIVTMMASFGILMAIHTHRTILTR